MYDQGLDLRGEILVEVVGLNKLVVVAWFPEIRREHLGDFHFEKEREGYNLRLILNLKERNRFLEGRETGVLANNAYLYLERKRYNIIVGGVLP